MKITRSSLSLLFAFVMFFPSPAGSQVLSETRVENQPPAALVFVRGNTLWLINKGQTVPVQLDSKEWISPSSPMFLDSSGEKILFSAHKRERYPPSRGEINIDVSDIFTWDCSLEKQTEALTRAGAISRAPDATPDRQKIVFVSNSHAKLRGLMPGTNSTELYAIDHPWKIPSRLTSDGGFKYNPRISPDGWKVAYLWLKEDGTSGIYMIDLSAPKDLPCHIADSGDYPTWRADGKALVYAQNGKLYEAEIPARGCPIPDPRSVLPASFRGFASFPKYTDYGIIFQFAEGRKQGIALFDPSSGKVTTLVSGIGEFGAADLAPR